MSPRAWVSALTLTLIFWSAVLLAFTAASHADNVQGIHNVAPMTNAYGDALIRDAMVEATRGWDSHGNCATVDLVVYDGDDRNHPAGAVVGSCRVYWNRSYRNSMWAGVNDPHAPVGTRRYELSALCGVAYHEYGHAVIGLGHIPDTIMDGDRLTIPQACYAWAATKLALLRQAHRRTRSVHRH